jgi:hypothetical protein
MHHLKTGGIIVITTSYFKHENTREVFTIERFYILMYSNQINVGNESLQINNFQPLVVSLGIKHTAGF